MLELCVSQCQTLCMRAVSSKAAWSIARPRMKLPWAEGSKKKSIGLNSKRLANTSCVTLKTVFFGKTQRAWSLAKVS